MVLERGTGEQKGRPKVRANHVKYGVNAACFGTLSTK